MTALPTSQPTRRRSAVSVVLVVIGVVVLTFTLGTGVVAGVAAAGGSHDTLTAPVAGVEAVEVDVDRTTLVVRFDDVPDATLDVEQPGLVSGNWTLERRGGALEVRSPRSWGPFNRWSDTDATLVLPRRLAGEVSLAADVAAGEATIDGDFTDVDLQLNAGRVTLAGAAHTLAVGVNAGDARITAADVTTIRASVQAGSMTGTFTGAPPRQVTANVSAGHIDLAVPEAAYAVTRSSALGSTGDLRIRQDPASANTIDLSVQLGEITVDYSK
ncbi:hypothetical protein [Pseudactinotalea sp. HY158]|uniref:hypothetical protein n=1 Tax=Pseudactinotalea sp. HY158 TaxID=2654547 RepID=UPI00129CA265|nr:hypothetical protein [Pseudactinotalea sp. HY158]QGH70251.1 hypothetical protein GCE65_12620 [Pseudactinotalea sp. HY158]